MPQFDVFSFYSQLFWVFFCFLFTYLLLCYYLLPSLSGILKVRKYKLSLRPIWINESVAIAIENTYDPYLQEVSKNVASLTMGYWTPSPILKAPISRFFLVRSFSSTILTSLQIPAFLLAPKTHN